MNKTCNGVRTSGHWKGCKCNSKAIYQHEGKSYCGNHAAELFRIEIIEKDKLIAELEQENERLRGELKTSYKAVNNLYAENKQNKKQLYYMRNCVNCENTECDAKFGKFVNDCIGNNREHWTASDKYTEIRKMSDEDRKEIFDFAMQRSKEILGGSEE